MDLNDFLRATDPAAAAPSAPAFAPIRDITLTDDVWQKREPVEFLPNGQPLKCTLFRTMAMADVLGCEYPPFPSMLASVFLYLCAHPAEEWSRPVTIAPGEVRPLWRAPEALISAAANWADAALAGLTPTEVANLAARLWFYHDETRVTPQKKTELTAMTPPASSPASSSSGSGSLPAAMLSAPLSSPMISPSATSTPPSTAPSSPAASPA